MEEILKAIDDYAFFRLDDRGIIQEVHNFEEDIEGEPFLNIVSEEDRKKAAKLFMESLQHEKAEGVLRIKRNSYYQIFTFKFLKIEDAVYGIAREIKREEPSFIADFLGNVIYACDEWKILEGKNLFDAIEDRNRLINAIRIAIETGEYEGDASINDREMRIRIKATQWLEFFIEEDVYKLLKDILDGRSAKEIFDGIVALLNEITTNYYVKLFDMEAGEKKEALYSFSIVKQGEIVGEIEIYDEIGEKEKNLLHFLSIAASKSVEELEDISKILQNFALYKIDANGKIKYVNKKFEEITGYGEKEVLNRNVAEFAENREEFNKEMEKGWVENFISKWKGKDRDIIAKEHARKINGEIIVLLEDITYEKEKEKEAEFYNSVLRHDIFNKNEIALGYLGLLEKTNLTKKQKTYLQKIKEVIGDANKLIEKVRKAEEIRKAKGHLHSIDIKETVEKICEDYGEELKQHDIEMECSVEAGEILADDFISEIFSNLIKNSIQHAKCKKIRIEGKREQEFYKIFYEDDGVGIDEKYKDKIFEEGWRLGGSGSGLGLYIVKKLMTRYGGKIEVETGAGKGIKFTLYFRMPRRRGKAEFLKIRI